jgi:hypothetical protein
MATYDPNNPEIIGLEQQRALAKALMQQGLNDNLQGQMVSGRYVGASPWQGIAKLANIWAGKSIGEEATQKEQAIAQKLRQQGVKDIEDVIGKITFGRCNIFNASLFKNESYDVLKFDVEGEGIHSANEMLKEFPHTSTSDSLAKPSP